MRVLLVTGGPYHPFDTTAPTLASLLRDEGIEPVVSGDVDGALRSLAEFDLLALYLLRWRMRGAMFDADRDRWAGSLSDEGREAILDHLGRGRGVLAMHTAAVCFDDWPEWADILGAVWDWERSSHPPPRPSPIHVVGPHPIVDGLDDFEVVDEIYSFLDDRGVTPLLTSPRRGVEQPVLWAHSAGGGRVVYDALGHDDRSLAHPIHATVIRRAARWALGGDVRR